MRVSNNTPPQLLSLGALGDAYGFCFEFVEPAFVHSFNDLSYHQHPEFTTVTPGRYSDDTQMQLGLAELLIQEGSDWSPLKVADQFVSVYKRDPRPGYAKRFRCLLDEVSCGQELLTRLNPQSERNGAAMRASVIGLLPGLELVKHLTALQASVTHNTSGGIDSAIASALICHYFRFISPNTQELPDFLSDHIPTHDWYTPWQGRVPVHGISTVQAALTALRSSSSLSQILKRCISFTGDVDSVATIACSCSAVNDQIRKDLPTNLWTNLENTSYGLNYLQKIDKRLHSASLP